MNAFIKKSVSAVLALSLVFGSAVIPDSFTKEQFNGTVVQAAETGSYSYGGATFTYELLGNEVSSTAKLTSVTKTNDSSVVIPSTINVNGKSYTVIEIGNDFLENAIVKNVTLPNTVLKIGYDFCEGSKISYLKVGTGVKEIGIDFCKDASSLTSVVYSGNSLETIGSDAFSNTPFINAPNRKGAVNMGEWLIKYSGTASSIRILDLAYNSPDITKIAPKAFYDNETLESVNLNNTKIICDYAFRDCSKLSTVSDGYSLANVGGYSFDGTAWYDSQDTKNNGTVVLQRVLLNYDQIVNGTVDLSNLPIEYIANGALSRCARARTLNLPGSIKNIDRYAITTSNTMSAISAVQICGNAITYSNYKSQYNNFLSNNMKALTNSDFGYNMANSKAHDILNQLGIEYIGVGKKKSLTKTKEYEIINKLYHYVGGTYKYKYSFEGGSQNYIEELLFQKGIICRDYAEMYMYLLERAGVNAEIIDGGDSATNPNHAFNVVEVGADWFYVDTCWYASDNLFMVNRETVEKEKSSHIVCGYTKSSRIPSEMTSINFVPYCKYTLGDVNLDGKASIADLATLQQYYAGNRKLTELQLILSDRNKDGKFNEDDKNGMW